MGYDPTGCWNWETFFKGAIITLATTALAVSAVVTFGASAAAAVTFVAATFTTGALLTYGAASEETIVLDVSASKNSGGIYFKGGVSAVIDFKQGRLECYPHFGLGMGYSEGVSFSAGVVEKYKEPNGYSGFFIDGNGGVLMGADHCWDPSKNTKTRLRQGQQPTVTFFLDTEIQATG